MKPSLQVAMLASGFVVGLGLAYAWGARQPNDALTEISSRLDQIEHKQRLMADAYLTRNFRARAQLAQDMGFRRNPAGSTAPGVLADAPGKPFTPEDAEQVRRQFKAKFENKFNSEPINPAWAGTTTQGVQDAIVEAVIDGSATPGGVQIDCRSQTCRVRLQVPNDASGGLFTDNFMATVAKYLPNAGTIETPSKDGKTLTLQIYASADPRRAAQPGS